MKLKNSLMFLSSLMLFVIIGCSTDDDNDGDGGGVTLIETPATYTFTSRFDATASSVSYSGQVVRNLLINDIGSQMKDDAGPGGTSANVLSMMANDDEDRLISNLSSVSTDQTKYREISSSHLNDRLEAVSDIIIPGYNANAGTLIAGWAAEAAAAGNTRANGLQLDQITQKTLWGAVSYWQATSKYLISKLEGSDNTTQVDDGGTLKPYTKMEHYWDESFGYFGAAVDYHTGYADDSDRKSDPYYDSDSDGMINFLSEVNSGWAITAAKRDVCGDCDVNYDFTKTIFDAYLEGRTLITNQADPVEVLAQKDIVVNTWEKVVAAVSVHYVNDVIADIAGFIAAGDTTIAAGSDATADYEKHWAEMRGYANGLLYNTEKLISDDYLNRIFTVMGTYPLYPENGSFDNMQAYHDQLKNEVRQIFAQSYGFSQANVAGW
tara:strand:+ start:301 stop:1608 length:1308 start_codon:yes stop_codon:yes gene_type:complete